MKMICLETGEISLVCLDTDNIVKYLDKENQYFHLNKAY